jgi:hypothetical protein
MNVDRGWRREGGDEALLEKNRVSIFREGLEKKDGAAIGEWWIEAGGERDGIRNYWRRIG